MFTKHSTGWQNDTNKRLISYSELQKAQLLYSSWHAACRLLSGLSSGLGPLRRWLAAG